MDHTQRYTWLFLLTIIWCINTNTAFAAKPIDMIVKQEKILGGPLIIETPQYYSAPDMHVLILYIPYNETNIDNAYELNGKLSEAIVNSMCFILNINASLEHDVSHISLSDLISSYGGKITSSINKSGILIMLRFPYTSEAQLYQIYSSLLYVLKHIKSLYGQQAIDIYLNTHNITLSTQDTLSWMASNILPNDIILLNMPHYRHHKHNVNLFDIINTKAVFLYMEPAFKPTPPSQKPELYGLLFFQNDKQTPLLTISIPTTALHLSDHGVSQFLKYILTTTDTTGLHGVLLEQKIITNTPITVAYDKVNQQIDITFTINLEPQHSLNTIVGYITTALSELFSENNERILCNRFTQLSPRNLANTLKYEYEFSNSDLQALANHLQIIHILQNPRINQNNHDIQTNILQQAIATIRENISKWKMILAIYNIKPPSAAIPVGKEEERTVYIPLYIVKKSLSNKTFNVYPKIDTCLPPESLNDTYSCWTISAETAVNKAYNIASSKDNISVTCIPWDVPKATCIISATIPNSMFHSSAPNDLSNYLSNIPEIQPIRTKLSLLSGNIDIYATKTGCALQITSPYCIIEQTILDIGQAIKTHYHNLSSAPPQLRSSYPISLLQNPNFWYIWIIGKQSIHIDVQKATEIFIDMVVENNIPQISSYVDVDNNIPSASLTLNESIVRNEPNIHDIRYYVALFIAEPVIYNCVWSFFPNTYETILPPYEHQIIFQTTSDNTNKQNLKYLTPIIIYKISRETFDALNIAAISNALFSQNTLAYHLAQSNNPQNAINEWISFTNTLLTITFKEWAAMFYKTEIWLYN